MTCGFASLKEPSLNSWHAVESTCTFYGSWISDLGAGSRTLAAQDFQSCVMLHLLTTFANINVTLYATTVVVEGVVLHVNCSTYFLQHYAFDPLFVEALATSKPTVNYISEKQGLSLGALHASSTFSNTCGAPL